ncbi:Gfo/Idh/MocA family protein [Lichenicoccus roseus]|uniref:Gfo/Idh/MocA family oxidoreductase n=1 Tax=Lichenicoccus roseus TaxID=2683649 RepID=A0A5R9J284_9PROT|nr:Gfo/Idh/MocA family oxidoreductase [Lichenicoccus roseus]TLU70973.1 Gfo/Idh/MocA family oxidoreductase [Lichenicoccus roseus]
MDAVTVGIVGCGTISAAYLRAALDFPEYRIVACADLDLARAQARAAKFDLRALSVEALLDDPSIEVVLNLTIPAAHAEIGLRAVEAGKHVYSEKPLGLAVPEARQLVERALERGMRVGSAPDTFLGGAHQTVRAALDADQFGRIVSGTACMMNHGHEHWHQDPGFYYQPGGGPLFDMGPYYLTALIDLLGPVASVCALTDRSAAERVVGSGPKAGTPIDIGTETHIAGLLRFATGAAISLITSFDVWAHRHSPIELYGTKGSVLVPDPNRFDGQPMMAIARAPWVDLPVTHGFAEADHRGVGLADMARAIRSQRAHRANGEMALHVVDIMQGLIEAGATGRTVDIATRCERPSPLPRRREIGLLD